jgi:hypothetical protein
MSGTPEEGPVVKQDIEFAVANDNHIRCGFDQSTAPLLLRILTEKACEGTLPPWPLRIGIRSRSAFGRYCNPFRFLSGGSHIEAVNYHKYYN